MERYSEEASTTVFHNIQKEIVNLHCIFDALSKCMTFEPELLGLISSNLKKFEDSLRSLVLQFEATSINEINNQQFNNPLFDQEYQIAKEESFAAEAEKVKKLISCFSHYIWPAEELIENIEQTVDITDEWNVNQTKNLQSAELPEEYIEVLSLKQSSAPTKIDELKEYIKKHIRVEQYKGHIISNNSEENECNCPSSNIKGR